MSDDIEVITDAKAAQAQNRQEAPPEPQEAPPVVEAAAPPETPETPPETPPAPEEKVKSREKSLAGRMGYITKRNHELERQLADAQAQIGTYQKIVGPKDQNGAPTTPQVAPETVEARVQEELFRRDLDAVWQKGSADHGEPFQEACQALAAAGLNTPMVLNAALATDNAPEVLLHLGDNLEEAARIANLPPLKMAAELTKIAQQVTAKAAPQISRAPAPIKPVAGLAKPDIDIYDPNLDDDEYYRRRKQQGAWYAPGLKV